VDRTKRHDRARQSRHGERGAGIVNPRARQRAFCIAVLPPGGPTAKGHDDLAELKELMRTAGVAVAGELIQRRPHADGNNYLGKGKLADLKEAIAASGANLVACDDELAPRQERNLEQATGLPVVDRTAIILDIFADHAASAEGKLQVELAQLQYNLARMRGLWTHLERLGGGIGTRGPGESQIETDRRLARDRIAQLKRRLERSERARALGRSRRELAFRHPEAVLVSALTREGLDALGERIAAEFERTLRDVELLVPFSEGGTLSELHDLTGDIERTDTPEGVRVSVRLPAVVAERFGRYAVNGR